MRGFAGLIVLSLLVANSRGGDEVAAKIAQAKKELEARSLQASAEPMGVDEFLAALKRQTGNDILDRRQQKTQAKIAFAESGPLTFWKALDHFTARASCGYSTYGSDGAVALIDSALRSPHVSYHGIFRTAFKHGSVARNFVDGTGVCTLQLDVAWEPRFRPFYLGVGPVTATYAAGGAVAQKIVTAPGRGQLPVSGRGASEVDLLLPAPERAAPALTLLEGTFKFIGPSKMLTFRFADIKAKAALDQDEVTVRINEAKLGLDRWLFEVQIENPEGTPVLESFQTWLDNNRIYLEKAAGAKTQTWQPEPNEAILLETTRKAVVQYAFAAPPGKGKLADWTLVYRTPGRIVELQVPYQFKNVPLP